MSGPVLYKDGVLETMRRSMIADGLTPAQADLVIAQAQVMTNQVVNWLNSVEERHKPEVAAHIAGATFGFLEGVAKSRLPSDPG